MEREFLCSILLHKVPVCGLHPTVESSSFRVVSSVESVQKKCFYLKKDKVDKEEAEANARQTESKTNTVIYNFNLPNKADNLIKTTSRNNILLACASHNQGRAENVD